MRSVIGIDDLLARLSPSDATGHAKRVCQFNGLVRAQPIPATIHAKQTAYGFAKLVRIPLRIIVAGLVHVTNGNALHIGFAQKAKHHAQALSANADESHIDLVAGWNVAGAAEDATRHDAESKSRGSRLFQEFPPR